jgi:hypothetical protein
MANLSESVLTVEVIPCDGCFLSACSCGASEPFAQWTSAFRWLGEHVREAHGGQWFDALLAAHNTQPKSPAPAYLVRHVDPPAPDPVPACEREPWGRAPVMEASAFAAMMTRMTAPAPVNRYIADFADRLYTVLARLQRGGVVEGASLGRLMTEARLLAPQFHGAREHLIATGRLRIEPIGRTRRTRYVLLDHVTESRS